MFKCIYSGETDPEKFKKKEHVFPAGIGGVATLKRGIVSDSVNNMFSKPERDFMQKSHIILPRMFFGLDKKSPIHLLVSDTGYFLGYVSNKCQYEIRQFKIKESNNIEFHGSVPWEIDEIRKDFDKFKKIISNIKEWNVKKILHDKIIKDTYLIGMEGDKIFIGLNPENKELDTETLLRKNLFSEEILSQIEEGKETAVYSKENMTSHIKIIENITDSARIYSKIAFNVLCHLKGHEFVLRKEFDEIRNFILNGGENKFCSFVEKKEDDNALLFKELGVDFSNHLVSFVKLPQGEILAYVSLYGGFARMICLSNNYYDDFNVDCFICDYKEKKEYTLIEYLNKKQSK